MEYCAARLWQVAFPVVVMFRPMIAHDALVVTFDPTGVPGVYKPDVAGGVRLYELKADPHSCSAFWNVA
jgi:hypothetical protein